MAPRAKSSVARKAVTIKKEPKKAGKATEKLADLLDNDEGQNKKPAKRARSNVRTLDEKVRKKIRDTYSGFTEMELSLTQNNGKNGKGKGS